MPFIILTFIAALLIEGIGTFISVLGLAAIFASNPIIMIMAVVLDFAKLITVSFVYKKWTSVNKVMRSYMIVAAAVLMTITSAGAFGYLSAEFQNAIIPSKESSIKLQTLTDEQTRLQARKQEMDKQIADTPQTGRGAVSNRIKLINSFKDETKRVNDRLAEIDTELPKLKINEVNVSVHTGPIAYVATAFNISMESAVKYVILLIIFVFDPLAISLILAGNFLVEEREKKNKEASVKEVTADTQLPGPEAIMLHPSQLFDSKEEYEAEVDKAITEIAIDKAARNPYKEISETEEGKKALLNIIAKIAKQHEDDEEEEPAAVETDKIEPTVVPAQSIALYQSIPEEDPEPSVITREQLDKMYKERLPYGEDLIPKELSIEKKVFTSEAESDIIEIQTKGIMNSASRHYPGAEVAFEASPSTIVKAYSDGTLSQNPELI